MLTHVETQSTLARELESRILQSTYGRIRDLSIEEVQGSMVIRGSVPSHHMRQLALHGALELLAGGRFDALITVD